MTHELLPVFGFTFVLAFVVVGVIRVANWLERRAVGDAESNGGAGE